MVEKKLQDSIFKQHNPFSLNSVVFFQWGFSNEEVIFSLEQDIKKPYIFFKPWQFLQSNIKEDLNTSINFNLLNHSKTLNLDFTKDKSDILMWNKNKKIEPFELIELFNFIPLWTTKKENLETKMKYWQPIYDIFSSLTLSDKACETFIKNASILTNNYLHLIEGNQFKRDQLGNYVFNVPDKDNWLKLFFHMIRWYALQENGWYKTLDKGTSKYLASFEKEALQLDNIVNDKIRSIKMSELDKVNLISIFRMLHLFIAYIFQNSLPSYELFNDSFDVFLVSLTKTLFKEKLSQSTAKKLNFILFKKYLNQNKDKQKFQNWNNYYNIPEFFLKRWVSLKTDKKQQQINFDKVCSKEEISLNEKQLKKAFQFLNDMIFLQLEEATIVNNTIWKDKENKKYIAIDTLKKKYIKQNLFETIPSNKDVILYYWQMFLFSIIVLHPKQFINGKIDYSILINILGNFLKINQEQKHFQDTINKIQDIFNTIEPTQLSLIALQSELEINKNAIIKKWNWTQVFVKSYSELLAYYFSLSPFFKSLNKKDQRSMLFYLQQIKISCEIIINTIYRGKNNIGFLKNMHLYTLFLAVINGDEVLQAMLLNPLDIKIKGQTQNKQTTKLNKKTVYQCNQLNSISTLFLKHQQVFWKWFVFNKANFLKTAHYFSVDSIEQNGKRTIDVHDYKNFLTLFEAWIYRENMYEEYFWSIDEQPLLFYKVKNKEDKKRYANEYANDIYKIFNTKINFTNKAWSIIFSELLTSIEDGLQNSWIFQWVFSIPYVFYEEDLSELYCNMVAYEVLKTYSHSLLSGIQKAWFRHDYLNEEQKEQLNLETTPNNFELITANNPLLVMCPYVSNQIHPNILSFLDSMQYSNLMPLNIGINTSVKDLSDINNFDDASFEYLFYDSVNLYKHQIKEIEDILCLKDSIKSTELSEYLYANFGYIFPLQEIYNNLNFSGLNTTNQTSYHNKLHQKQIDGLNMVSMINYIKEKKCLDFKPKKFKHLVLFKDFKSEEEKVNVVQYAISKYAPDFFELFKTYWKLWFYETFIARNKDFLKQVYEKRAKSWEHVFASSPWISNSNNDTQQKDSLQKIESSITTLLNNTILKSEKDVEKVLEQALQEERKQWITLNLEKEMQEALQTSINNSKNWFLGNILNKQRHIKHIVDNFNEEINKAKYNVDDIKNKLWFSKWKYTLFLCWLNIDANELCNYDSLFAKIHNQNNIKQISKNDYEELNIIEKMKNHYIISVNYNDWKDFSEFYWKNKPENTFFILNDDLENYTSDVNLAYYDLMDMYLQEIWYYFNWIEENPLYIIYGIIPSIYNFIEETKYFEHYNPLPLGELKEQKGSNNIFEVINLLIPAEYLEKSSFHNKTLIDKAPMYVDISTLRYYITSSYEVNKCLIERRIEYYDTILKHIFVKSVFQEVQNIFEEVVEETFKAIDDMNDLIAISWVNMSQSLFKYIAISERDLEQHEIDSLKELYNKTETSILSILHIYLKE